MKIVAISDVHNKYKNLVIPKCDILISCGDYSFKGTPAEVHDFHTWLNEQEAGHIISVQGNHELHVESDFEKAKKIATDACPAVHFIAEGLVEIEGLKIWCSAITPWFYDWAWNRERGHQIRKHWNKIRLDTDILVTHGPPEGILDIVYYADGVTPKNRVGCADLWRKIQKLKKLKHHFFGHIHGSYGHQEHNGVHYWNVAICDESYMPSNLPVEIEL